MKKEKTFETYQHAHYLKMKTFNPKFSIILLFILTVITLSAYGCNRGSSWGDWTPDNRTDDDDCRPVEITDELVETARIPSQMRTRAIDFRQNMLSQNDTTRNSIYVYSATMKAYLDAPEVLAARIAVLGFKDVYLSTGKAAIDGSDENGYAWTRRFIAALTGYGIKAYALRLSDTSIFADKSKVDADVALVKNYNAQVNSNERYAGISADLEPHVLKEGKVPEGVPYTWNSETNYGIGKDNDNLVRITIERLSDAGNLLHPSLKLCEAIFTSFQS